MKKLVLILSILLSPLLFARPVSAASYPTAEETGLVGSFIGAINKQLVPIHVKSGTESKDWYIQTLGVEMQHVDRYLGGKLVANEDGDLTSNGLLGIQKNVLVAIIQSPGMPSQREYYADIIDNIGLPTISQAYAQGTGYAALNSFLPFWKVFRNLAYSLYIVMFVVVGVMIMLRTKVNAQTIITIQSALPNLLITLLLITFSYAIVGFMIDIMYFLIYFVVYLMNLVGIIETPTTAISRLLSYSAWSVIFEGRNSIISAASLAISEVLSGIGTGAFELAGTIISLVSPMYLIVAIAFAIAMIKLMVALIKAYIMIIVQTITAPVQILMNAMPGSKAFGQWIKTTASYILPFPVAAIMFIFAAVMVGDPTQATIIEWAGDANPFGINQSHEFYSTGDEEIWLPPFTLTGSVDFTNDDIRVLIGFFIFLMTPAAVKMAQDWLQVKESPYSAEAFSSLGMGVNWGTMPLKWAWGHQEEEMKMRRQAELFNGRRVAAGPSGEPPKNT